MDILLYILYIVFFFFLAIKPVFHGQPQPVFIGELANPGQRWPVWIGTDNLVEQSSRVSELWTSGFPRCYGDFLNSLNVL